MPTASSKVTSKLQVTIPKAIAERFGIRPGDTIGWEAAGAVLRVVPPGRGIARVGVDEKLELLARARQRQREREAREPVFQPATDRGWSRDELYDRGRAD